jgi:ribose 5-phosphate isomerase B
VTDSKPIVIGADDAGLGLKGIIKGYLDDLGVAYDDVGVDTLDATALGIDYPDVAETAATGIRDGRYDRGILICGTGIGMAITANKVPGVRAAQAHDVYSAQRARKSNDDDRRRLAGVGVRRWRLDAQGRQDRRPGAPPR